MKKIFAALLAAVLILSACSSAQSGGGGSSEKPSAKTPVGSFTSSIFGRSADYDEWSPAPDPELPIPAEEIIGAANIGKQLYILGSGGVYRLDCETGEAEKLFDTTAETLTEHGGKLYTYSLGAAQLTEYDPETGAQEQTEIRIDGARSVGALLVTDGFYVVSALFDGQMYVETQVMVFSRETGELTLTKNAPRTGIGLFPYKGDKLLTTVEDEVFGNVSLGILDAKIGKNSTVLDIGDRMTYGARPAVAYCERTDTAVVLGGGVRDGMTSPCSLTELSLGDADSIVLDHRYIDISNGAKFFVFAYENAVLSIASSVDKCMVYNYLDPPESITILGYSTAPDVLEAFERDTGILIKNASTEYDKMLIKIMAGDDDFDIFNTGATGYHNFAYAGAFVDLATVDSLAERISGNAAVKLAVDYDGKFLGVPSGISSWSADDYPESSRDFYTLIAAENTYFARNIDVAEGRFDDPDGSELYKLFKYINDHPEGRGKSPFGEEATVLSSAVYMMSPNSHNKEAATRFWSLFSTRSPAKSTV